MQFERNYPECHIKLIPGITSFSDAAAKSRIPLAFQQEQLLVLPVPDSALKLKSLLVEAASTRRVLALLKIGKKWSWIRPLLQELDLLEKSVLAENVGFKDEHIVKACDFLSCSPSYFSLLLIRQSWPYAMP